MYIYSIEFANGSKYVGKTNNFARRWEEHKKGNGCPATKNQDFTGARFILESTLGTYDDSGEEEQKCMNKYGGIKKLLNKVNAQVSNKRFYSDYLTNKLVEEAFQKKSKEKELHKYNFNNWIKDRLPYEARFDSATMVVKSYTNRFGNLDEYEQYEYKQFIRFYNNRDMPLPSSDREFENYAIFYVETMRFLQRTRSESNPYEVFEGTGFDHHTSIGEFLSPYIQTAKKRHDKSKKQLQEWLVDELYKGMCDGKKIDLSHRNNRQHTVWLDYPLNLDEYMPLLDEEFESVTDKDLKDGRFRPDWDWNERKQKNFWEGVSVILDVITPHKGDVNTGFMILPKIYIEQHKELLKRLPHGDRWFKLHYISQEWMDKQIGSLPCYIEIDSIYEF